MLNVQIVGLFNFRLCVPRWVVYIVLYNLCSMHACYMYYDLIDWST